MRYPCINNTPMLKSYTPDDLLLLIYDELDDAEKTEIHKALEADSNLNQIYQMLLQVTGSLNTLSYEPDPSTIEIILEHSQHEEHFH